MALAARDAARWGLLQAGNMDKKTIRSQIRSAVGPFKGSEDIFRKVETISGFNDSDIVLLYWSIDGEPDTHPFIQKWAGRKKIVLPVVKGEILELKEYVPELMLPGYRGILEPSDDAPTVSPQAIGFAIIPGMAFDRQGRRLGRGKGYYDRLLPGIRCMKAGVAFEHQVIDEVPVEEHDVLMDMVITPNNCYLCRQ